MVSVRGMSFRVVTIPDLGDRIYYNQVKQFSEQQVSLSTNLREAIAEGRVAVLEGHIPQMISQSVEAENRGLQQVVEELREEVQNLSSKVQEAPPPSKVIMPEVVKESVADVKILEMQKQIDGLCDIIKQQTVATEKVIKDSVDKVANAVSTLSVSGVGVQTIQSPAQNVESSYKEEVFVPSSIVVTDMTNKVTLKTQEVGQADSSQAALNKLRMMKQKQSNTGG